MFRLFVHNYYFQLPFWPGIDGSFNGFNDNSVSYVISWNAFFDTVYLYTLIYGWLYDGSSLRTSSLHINCISLPLLLWLTRVFNNGAKWVLEHNIIRIFNWTNKFYHYKEFTILVRNCKVAEWRWLNDDGLIKQNIRYWIWEQERSCK